jgi:hypothetical protein
LIAAVRWGAARGGGNADEVTGATTASAAASRIGADGGEGQSARDEKSDNRSFDKSAHDLPSPISCSAATVNRNILAAESIELPVEKIVVAKNVARSTMRVFDAQHGPGWMLGPDCSAFPSVHPPASDDT